jgi:hypothetical protein
MSHSCSWDDMAGTFTPYDRDREAAQALITSHKTYRQRTSTKGTSAPDRPNATTAQNASVDSKAPRKNQDRRTSKLLTTHMGCRGRSEVHPGARPLIQPVGSVSGEAWLREVREVANGP